MIYTANEDTPRTISDLVSSHMGVALIFPNGIPSSLPNPVLQVELPDYVLQASLNEESIRSNAFRNYERWSRQIPDIPLIELVEQSQVLALEWIHVEKFYAWISIWMSAAIYEHDYLKQTSDSWLWLLENRIFSLLDRGVLPVPHDALLYYIDMFFEKTAEDDTFIVYEGYNFIDKAHFASLKMIDRGF